MLTLDYLRSDQLRGPFGPPGAQEQPRREGFPFGLGVSVEHNKYLWIHASIT